MEKLHLTVTEVTDGLLFPEGPIALEDGSVLVVEIAGGRLTRVLPGGRKVTVAETGGGPNGAAMGPDGKVYVCNNGGFRWHRDDNLGLRPNGQAEDYVTGSIQRVDIETGKVETLYDRGPKGPLRGPNDIVFDRSGGFWFTDSGKNRPRDLDRGGVYYANANGSFIDEVLYPVWTPNGVGLSEDENTLYVSETCTGRLWSFPLSAPGVVEKKPWPSYQGGTLVGAVPGRVNMQCDSLALDSAGNICVAVLSSEGGIALFAPDGSSVTMVPIDDPMVSNICFGGKDLTTAYATLSGRGKLVSMPWPRPGLPLNFLNK